MRELVCSVLCSRGIVDKFTNSLSIIDVIDGLTLGDAVEAKDEEVPSITLDPPLTLVQVWSRDDACADEPFTIRIVVVSPSGKKFHMPGRELSFNKKQTLRGIIRIGSIPFTGPGKYRFVSQEKYYDKNGQERWRKTADTPLNIEISNADPAQAPN